MIRRLPLVLVFLAFAAAPQALGSEPEVTPIIHFGDPADAVRITVARARLSPVTGTRVNAGGTAARVDFEQADWPELLIRPAERAGRLVGDASTRATRRQPDGRANRFGHPRRRRPTR